MRNIAIFASGSGSNAEAIVRHLRMIKKDSVKLILSNNPDAFVLERAKNLEIPSAVFNREQFFNSNNVLQLLENKNIDLIVLAGFLWLVPANILKRYAGAIINIHPALLPKYGGKGMYGMKVHESVIANNEKESGITIHYINEVYDEGEIILQAKCDIEPTDTPEMLAHKIHLLEYEHFPKVVEKLISK